MKKIINNFFYALTTLCTFSQLYGCETCDNSNSAFYCGVDYLYWKAEEDQLQYALNIPGGFPQSGLAFANQIDVVNPCFKGQSGVRLTAGYEFCQNWDVALAWAHLQQTSCSSIENSAFGIVATTAFGFIDFIGPVATKALSTWCYNLNMVDFEVGREWHAMHELDLRPFLGFSWIRLNQRQTINYEGIINLPTATMQKTNNFSAIGPRAGIDASYYVWNNISLVATVSGALMYGTFNIKDQGFFVGENNINLSPFFAECKKRLRPTAQIILGFEWEKEVCNCADVELGIAYEVHYWWNMWQTPNSAAAATAGVNNVPGDFTTHGLTVHAGVRF